MSEENGSPEVPPNDERKHSDLAASIGFLPLALLLAEVGFVKLVYHPDLNGQALLLGIVCVVSVICCFTSSFMLFARRTTEATLAGIVFMLLDGGIAFWSGVEGAILAGIIELKF